MTDDFSYETMAEDIFSFINALEPGGVSLVGFSDGAVISLFLALKYPDIIKKMALLGVNLKPSDFKKKGGYLRSIELSRQYDLYRQDYCGCVFSKRERGGKF